MLLARLAVDKSVQGRGIGAFLLRDAMSRALSVAEQAGMRLLLVHALNDDARAFYEHFGFGAHAEAAADGRRPAPSANETARAANLLRLIGASLAIGWMTASASGLLSKTY